MKCIKIISFLFLCSLLSVAVKSVASKVVEVLPLTNKVIMVHFDDGSMVYPNTLSVNRLNITDADNKLKWLISSSDDVDFQTEKNPIQIGRKTKGTEFVKDPKWGGNSFDPREKPWASEHWLYLVLDQELKSGKTYSLNTGTLAENGSSWNFVFDEKSLRSEAVHVNTLGYAAKAPKFGYIYQWMGSLGNLDLTDFIGKKFWVFKAGEELPVKEGTIQKRKSATNAETSQPDDTPNRNFLGAEVLDCDFSDVTANGTYQLVVESIGASYPFKIGEDAVWDAYYNVARALYYQRSGIRLAPPYTTGSYIRPVNQNTKVTSDNGSSFAGKLLYSDYSFLDWAEGDGGGASQEAIRAAANGKTLDVAGWYHDAGDWDSYWSHQRVPMLLMLTWEFAPDRFGDNELNIPESGNGIPDLLDEASWLIKFNYRLRKELKSKGYSDGGLGGARICADVFTEIDGNAESTLPSWKENRRTVVTKADAFMTYIYAGEAAQFACILKRLGKNPKQFQVENLDDVDFEKMSKDEVNWITEAEEAYAWASAPGNQPSGNKNYSSKLEVYKMYAAVNLFRLTGKEEYHKAAKTELSKLQNTPAFSEDERWGAFSYLLSTEIGTDKNLQNALKNVTLNMADNDGVISSNSRACRWGGNFSFPMLVGQATTPAVFESMVAACITGEKKYENVVHTTADYFLGTNPLHSTWITGVGPRPAACGFHLDSRYNNNWVNYPGFIPYGPWSMAYGYTPYTWVIDGASIQGGHGPWNKDWANFSMFPLMENWPGHERWNSNIHAPMSSENTIHQNTVYGALTYGFVNSRHYENGSAEVKIGSVILNKNEIIFSEKGLHEEITANLDIENATFSALKWTSSDARVAHVDAFGKVTAVNTGSCQITCSTLDGSVSAVCSVTCNWTEIGVTSIQFNPESFSLFTGQSKMLSIIFVPDSATNKLVNYTIENPGIAEIDETGRLTALKEGVTIITATSLSGGKTAQCTVTVEESTDYIIADFDVVIPVTTVPQPFVAQLYTPDGTNDIAFANPMKGDANNSEKVVKWARPPGDWRLIGMVLPTNLKPDLSQFKQFQFKYYGKEIQDFYIQIKGNAGDIEVNQSVEGEDCWQLFTYDISSSDSLLQFNIFANKSGYPNAINCFFDDFKLTGVPAIWTSGTTISETKIELDKGDMIKLTADANGNPFSWISSNLAVVTVDQDGNVTAVGGGTTTIKAVPLYGESVECVVTVEGAETPVFKDEVFLDFENIVLDWASGYGAYSWNSDAQFITSNPSVDISNPSAKVYQWTRDITGNATWGGYGIVLPVKNTEGWERISFQIFASAPVSTVRFEPQLAEVKQGEIILSNLNIQANQWTTVTFPLADMGLINKNFDKVQMQIAGGSNVPLMTIYSDNFKFEKGLTVSANDFSNPETANVQVYPNPAIDKVNVKCFSGITSIELYSVSGKRVFAEELKGEDTYVFSKKSLNAGLHLIRITDNSGYVYVNKLVFEKNN